MRSISILSLAAATACAALIASSAAEAGNRGGYRGPAMRGGPAFHHQGFAHRGFARPAFAQRAWGGGYRHARHGWRHHRRGLGYAAGAAIAGRPVRVTQVPRWLLAMAAGLCDGLSGISGAMLPLSRDKLGELYRQRWVARGDRPCGWSPKIGFAEGAGQTMQWYRDAGWI